MNEISNLDLVIFDLDGTLIDSNGIHNDLDTELVHWLGESKNSDEIIAERNEFLKRNKGGDAYLNYCEYLKNKYNSKLSKEEILQYRRNLSKEFLKKVEYKPDADKAIKFLKEHNTPIALATVSRRDDINIYISENENIKNKCNLKDYFDFILTKDDVIERKPNPEVYNRIIKQFNINDLSKCIVVEDSLSGVLAAKNANLKVIVIYDKYADKDREQINKLADYKVDNFYELIQLFKKSKGEM